MIKEQAPLVQYTVGSTVWSTEYLRYSGVVLSLLRTSTRILRQVMAGGGDEVLPTARRV